MATQTIKFACQEVPATCPVRLISGGSPVAADSISEVYEGLMQATYTDLVGDYTIHPLTAGGDPLGVGAVYNVTNTAATFLENELLELSTLLTASQVYTVDPGATPPPAGSYGDKLNRLGQSVSLYGTVAASPPPTAAGFRLTLSAAVPTNGINDSLLLFSTGDLAFESSKPIASITFVSSTDVDVTFDEPFTQAPAAGDSAQIYRDTHIHPVTQVALAVWNALTSALTTSGSIGKRLLDWLAGSTNFAQWLGLIAAKHTGNTTARTELNATGAGSGTFDETRDSNEAIRDRGDAAWTGGGGGGLTGANTVVITVDDGTDPIVGAKVRLTDGVLGTGIIATDANGEAEFSVDDATWAVAITKAGYTFTPTTLVVNGDETQTYSMAAVTITPSDPGFVTGYLYCYDAAGDSQSGVTVSLRMTKAPDGDSGAAYYSGARTDTSDANGLVEFTGLVPGATYSLKRGTESFASFVVPAAATDPAELGSIIGAA